MSDKLHVQLQRCATCIFRRDHWTAEHLAALLDQVREFRRNGEPTNFFKGYRECHHAPAGSGVVCRGFWDHHRDDFQLGQLAQRLGWLEFVNIDILPPSKTR